MTEVNIPLYMPLDVPYRPGSCGKVYDRYFEVRVVDPETDEEMPRDSVGEIVVPLYKNQPVFGDVDLELRSLGFIPHMFADLQKRMILPLHFSDNIRVGLNQLLEADIVYVRERMTEYRLRRDD